MTDISVCCLLSLHPQSSPWLCGYESLKSLHTSETPNSIKQLGSILQQNIAAAASTNLTIPANTVSTIVCVCYAVMAPGSVPTMYEAIVPR